MDNIGQQTMSVLHALGNNHPRLMIILASASVVTFIIALAVDSFMARHQGHREKRPAISRRPR